MSADGRAVLAGGSAYQTTIAGMAGCTSVVSFRIIGVNGVANRGMATFTVIVHADHGVVVHRGMVVSKGAMAS